MNEEIEKVKEEKRILSNKIKILIQEFDKKTGVNITKINYDTELKLTVDGFEKYMPDRFEIEIKI